MHREPSKSITDMSELLLGQLSFQRGAVLAKLDGLAPERLTASVVPSGWTPLGLLNHLVHVERRWIRWGFEAEDVVAPWGDCTPEDQWIVPDGDPAEVLTEWRRRWLRGGRHTEDVVKRHDLTDRAAAGGRFESDPPTLGWILLHLIQEVGRHAGHLDIARELVDATVGE